MAGTFPISGHIDPKSFPFLLADLYRNGATGSLKVEGPTYQKALYFRNGRVLFGSSNDPRDQLGAILIEDGRITPEQLEDVNSKVGPGNPLAKVLAETGFVSQRELSEAARAKVERILSDVVAYTSGSFEFEDGVLPKGAVDLKLSTERLLLSAVRRVGDRGFVLRHLDGLDVVLRPMPELSEHRAELEPETGGLLDHLDGAASLKEAAGRTRLDDFEAAKVACGLLFLGVVDRRRPDPLDLGDTARAAIESDELPLGLAAPASHGLDAQAPSWATAEGDDTVLEDSSDQLVVPDAFSESDEAFAPAEPFVEIVEPMEEGREEIEPYVAPEPDEEPLLAVPPEPVRFVAPEPAAAPPPLRPAPEPAPPPVPRAPAPPAAFVPEPSPVDVPSPAARKQPSRDDLAALDALLDPRTLEGPLAPLERAPEPRPLSATRSVQARRSSGAGPVRLIALAAVLAVAGGGAAWYVWLRQPAEAEGGAATAAAPVPLRTTAPPPTAAAAPIAPASTLPAAPVSPPPSVVTETPGGLEGARELLRAGELTEAARGFESHFKDAGRDKASVQLLVACSPETVQKAVANVSASDLFILPVNYKGRDCYRLCWGIYDSQAAAAASIRSLPEYFVKGGASPRIFKPAELTP